jgi:DNA-binding transcriptional LysR family regulator
MRVATGEQVRPTLTSFLEHYKGPPVVAVPFSDLPPSEAVLVWRAAGRSAKVQAFVRAAADLLAAHPQAGPGAVRAAVATVGGPA